jgi:hypothetical protein
MYYTSITDFLRKPKPVLKKVSSEDVVLRRRGKDAVCLMAPERAGSASEGGYLAADLLANLVMSAGRGQISPRKVLGTLLEKRYPWMRFLPSSGRENFVHEIIKTLQAFLSIGKPAQLDEVVCSWKSTALIYSDPALAAELRRPLSGETRRLPRP